MVVMCFERLDKPVLAKLLSLLLPKLHENWQRCGMERRGPDKAGKTLRFQAKQPNR